MWFLKENINILFFLSHTIFINIKRVFHKQIIEMENVFKIFCVFLSDENTFLCFVLIVFLKLCSLSLWVYFYGFISSLF